MGIYYKEVEEAIKNNERELRHLQEELKGLRSVEKDTPWDSYQRQEAQIRRHMATEESRLEGNRRLLDNYNLAKESFIKLEELRRLRGKETDLEVIVEMDEELAAREREFESSMGSLTDELRQELKDDFDELLSKTTTKTEEHIIDSSEVTTAKKEGKQTGTITEITDFDYDEYMFRAHEENGMEYHGDEDEPKKAEETPSTFVEPTNETSSVTAATTSSISSQNEDLAKTIANTKKTATKKKRTNKKKDTTVSSDESKETSSVTATTTSSISSQTEESEETIDNTKVTTTKKKRTNKKKGTTVSSDDSKETSQETSSVTATTTSSISSQNEDIAQMLDESKTTAVKKQRKVKTKKEQPQASTSSSTEEGKKEEVITTTTTQTSTETKKEETKVTDAKKEAETIIESSSTTTKQETIIEEDINQRRARVAIEYASAEAAYQEAIRRMQEIFQEEREEKERNGIILTETELDNFYDRYMQQKIKQNEVIEAAKKRRDNLQTSLRIIDTQIAAKTPILALPPHEKAVVVPQHSSGKGNPQNGEGKTKTEGEYEVTVEKNVPQLVYAPPQVKEETIVKIDNPNDYEVETIKNIPQLVYAPPQVKEETLVKIDNPNNYEVETVENIPQPVYAPPNIDEPVEVKIVEEKPKKGLITIFDELTDGLSLDKKDGKRYKASNIKIARDFKDELKSGNYLYNLVHLVPAIVKLPIQLLRKASGKIMLSAKSKKNAETLKERLNNLPPEELMTIYEEYRGNRVIQERYPTIMNALIDERMQRFALENVTRINDELEQRYDLSFDAISRVDAIDDALSDPEITNERREQLQNYRAQILEGQAENIEAIRNGYIEANNWLSGGAYGMSEDIKAATSKLSIVGKRFAKDHGLDNELLHQQALLEQKENAAIAAGDDEAALRAFVATETLLSDNTEISTSLVGRRSVGKKYYSPLVEPSGNEYENSVTDMVEEYAETQQELAEIERQSRK